MTVKRKWTDEQLIEAAKNARSIRQLLLALNLNPNGGGNYLQIKEHMKRLQLQINFEGQAWRKGSKKPAFAAKPLSEILQRNTAVQSFKLKNRLIKENILTTVCSACNLKEWLGSSIPLELDHINGDKYDNRLHNLRLLCPNCHALTPTYRGKNKKRY